MCVSTGEPTPSAPSAQTDAPIHCAECGKYNERDAVTCTKCGSHLWIKCTKCSHKNIRTTSRCAKCRKRLRARPINLPRLGRGLRNRKQKRLVLGFLFLILLAFAIWITVRSVPEAPTPERNVAVPF